MIRHGESARGGAVAGVIAARRGTMLKEREQYAALGPAV
jgi:hypothetical protein